MERVVATCKENQSYRKAERACPANAKKTSPKLPNEQRYMRGLGEIGDLADQTRGHALTASVVQARINRIKQKYALDAVRIEDRSEENVTVYVQHAAQNNRNNMVQVPIMSEAERVRLLAPAMEELQTQMNARANEQGKLNRTDADAIAHAIPQSHPVIESIRVVDGHSAWNFNVDIGDRNQQVPGKAKAEEAENTVTGETQPTSTNETPNGAELRVAKDKIDFEVEPVPTNMDKEAHTLHMHIENVENITIEMHSASRVDLIQKIVEVEAFISTLRFSQRNEV